MRPAGTRWSTDLPKVNPHGIWLGSGGIQAPGLEWGLDVPVITTRLMAKLGDGLFYFGIGQRQRRRPSFFRLYPPGVQVQVTTDKPPTAKFNSIAARKYSKGNRRKRQSFLKWAGLSSLSSEYLGMCTQFNQARVQQKEHLFKQNPPCISTTPGFTLVGWSLEVCSLKRQA